MRHLWMTSLLLGLLALCGCGEGAGTATAITDPSNLPPLTEADKAEILKRDADIQQQEQGTPVIVKKAGKKK